MLGKILLASEYTMIEVIQQAVNAAALKGI